MNVNDAAVFDKDPDGPRRILTAYDEELLAEFLDYLRGIRGYSVELDAGVSVPTPTLIAEFKDNLETVEAEDI
ncbi:hypothetical protein GS882_07660 [Rhodococcus hoagii]|uniref:Uncharacterized protein n=1 Tax=Rhodococcus hoagii TaxID=43767 RepID=A0A9Q5EZM0_RHOHA|nr:hypothetical protein [Prescottella equi]